MFKKKTENIVHKCAVHLLDDLNVVELEYLEIHKGSYLIDQLCHQLQIKEKDYFGLRYVDIGKQRQWLDLGKLIIKQCKDVNPLIFSFRIKFYPADPFHLSTNVRILLYKQLKRDVNHGRLYCSSDDFITLGALIIQEELGDYDENVHTDDYMSTLTLPVRQIDAIERKILNKHKERKKGQAKIAVIDEFLKKARSLEAYGIEPHCVKDQHGCQIYIGVNFSGISAFAYGKRSQHLRWSEIRKLNFEGRMFIAHLGYTDANRELKKYTVGYKCTSGAACRYLWRCAVEHMLFFTLPDCRNASKNYGGGIFSRGTKFKYTGRTEREILTGIIYASSFPLEITDTVNSKKANSVPATPSSPKGDVSSIRYNSLPRSKMPDLSGRYNQCTMDWETDSATKNSSEIQFQLANKNNTLNSNFENYYWNEGSLAFSENSATNITKHFNNVISKAHPNRITNVDNTTNFYQNNVKQKRNLRKFHILRSFLPSLGFVIASMILLVFIILESTLELFDGVRNAPEMIVLREDYYIPLKNFIYEMVIK